MANNIYQNRYEHLLDLIARHGGQTAIAEKLGVTKQYIHLVSMKDPTRVKNIGHKMARKIEEHFGLPINSLDEPLGSPSAQQDVDFVDVPLLNLVLAVSPERADWGGMVQELRISKRWLRHNTDATAYEQLARIELRDNSMEPTLGPGSTVLIDTAIRQIDGAGIYVLTRENDLFVRRIQKNIDGTITLICDNDAYKPETISGTLKAGIVVCGKVIAGLNVKKM